MSRAEYVRGAKHFLASFEKGETREYCELFSGFPWRSLAAIACCMTNEYGVKYKFKTDRKTGVRKITRIL